MSGTNEETLTAGENTGQKILEGIKDVEIDPTEVQQLFDHPHPLQLTEAQRAVIVESLRRSRGEYIVKKEAKRAKRQYKPKEESVKVTLDDLNLNLEDLI